MSAALTYEQLFDPSFLSAVSHWSLGAKRVARGGRHGERLSLDLGPGLEFNDYRAYSPGDDLRAIDWNLYRRLGKVYVRRFDEEQDLPLYVLPDISGSMFHDEGGAPAIVAALRSALALATVGLNHHDSSGLFAFADELETIFRPRAGHTQVVTFARQLAQLAARGGRRPTRLVASLRRFAQFNFRPGLLVVVSDFYDPAGIAALREAFRPIRHRLLLVRIARATDANPPLQGDIRVIDCESGEATDLTVNPALLARYRAAYTAFERDLATFAREREARLITVDTEGDVIAQLSSLFAHGGLRV